MTFDHPLSLVEPFPLGCISGQPTTRGDMLFYVALIFKSRGTHTHTHTYTHTHTLGSWRDRGGIAAGSRRDRGSPWPLFIFNRALSTGAACCANNTINYSSIKSLTYVHYIRHHCNMQL